MKEFLSKVYNDFKTNKEYWCNLNQSQFTYSKNADYQNKNYEDDVITQFYLLRYAPIYTYEYYEMYKQLLYYIEKYETLNILSIGVGVGLDFWGLSEALFELEKEINIDYIGLDPVKWKYQLDMKFLHKDLEELTIEDLKNYTLGEANIFVFPKSIIEIDENIIIKFAKLISFLYKDKKDIEIYFLISFIKSTDKIAGIDKIKLINEILEENGFIYSKIIGSKENEFDIEKIDYEQYLDYSITWQNDLKKHCTDCIYNDKCGLDNIWPMLKTKHLSYGIYKFKKGI